MLKLYETEALVFVERGEGALKKCDYWVLKKEGPNPLTTKHRVKKKDVPIAVALFKDHPRGIEKMNAEDMHFFEKEYWSVQKSVQHKAESV